MTSFLRSLAWRIAGWPRVRRHDDDFAEELQSHLALLIEENIRRGLPPNEAQRAARLKLGSEPALRETHHDQRTLLWLESLGQDVRFAFRMLRKNPGFTVLAVLTLALGIGVNATLFSAYNAVALKPLPIGNPGRVVRFERWFQSGSLGDLQYGFSYPEYIDCREHSHAFSGLVAASWLIPVQGSLPGERAPQRLSGQLVTANYFSEFGIRPVLGRWFAAGEDQIPAGNAVVVISYSFWRRAFENNSWAIGQTITLDNVPFTIIGIAPKQFTGTSIHPHVPDFWAPVSMQGQLAAGQDWLHDPSEQFFQIFGRLKPSASRSSAEAESDLLIRQFARTFLQTDKTTSVTLQGTSYFPNTDDIRFRALVAGLMLIVGLLLLVACANVGHMLLARAAARQREISTRRALGAGNGRIVRQLLAESVLLAIAAAAAGLLLSLWATDLLGTFLERSAALFGGDFSAVNLAPDWRVLTYALLVSLCAGTLLGLSPSLHLVRQDLASALKAETGSLGKISGFRVRGVLICAQVAASVLLLAMAGLLTRGLLRSEAADPGFDLRDNFLITGNLASLGLGRTTVVNAEIAMVGRLRARSDFSDVALGSVPYTGTWSPPILVGQAKNQTLASYASDTYFDQLGIPFITGRGFTPEESASGTPLAVISQSLARRFWPNQDPVGRTFQLDMNFQNDLHTFQVIGVVKDVRFANITRLDPGHVYVPVGTAGARGLGILVRLHGDQREALAAADSVVAETLKQPFPNLDLVNLDQGIAAQQRILSSSLVRIAGVLALLALALAGVGIYGVLAYLVTQRTREIGVRIALGATAGALLKDIVLAGLRPVFTGMALGIATAAALSTVMHHTLVFPGSMDFLFGVPFYDPITFGGIFCFVVMIAGMASAVPTRRAMSVDPIEVLRHE